MEHEEIKNGSTVRVVLSNRLFNGILCVVEAYSEVTELFTVHSDRQRKLFFRREEIAPHSDEPMTDDRQRLADALNALVTAARKYPITGTAGFVLSDANSFKFLQEAKRVLLKFASD